MFKRLIPGILLIILFIFTIQAVQAMHITFDTDQPPENISVFGISMRNFVASIQHEVDGIVNNALAQGGLDKGDDSTYEVDSTGQEP